MGILLRYNKRTYQYFSAICCLLIFIPLGLMVPLYQAGGMTSACFGVVIAFLIIFGVSILVG